MEPLDLPPYDFDLRQVAESRMIFDPIRRRYVPLTREEWVRQHLVQYLIRDRGYPRGLIRVEAAIPYHGMTRRADVLVLGRDGQPLLLAECKAPDVEVRQAAFDQIARYNDAVGARLLVVTNGLTHYCLEVDRSAGTYRFLDGVPPFDAPAAP